jgi:hypothetical protein
MAEITLRINGSERKVSVAPEMPLLWVLRDTLEMTGIWLRRRAVRSMHGSRRRHRHSFLRDSGIASSGQEHHNH